MPPHFGTAKVVDYRALFEQKEFVCSRCGYDEFSCSVDIHHIDGNRENNDKSNLIPYCANCHKALHGGKWNGDACTKGAKIFCKDFGSVRF